MEALLLIVNITIVYYLVKLVYETKMLKGQIKRFELLRRYYRPTLRRNGNLKTIELFEAKGN